MTTTTHSNFNDQTEALDVAAAFSDGIRGKTVVVTGVNRNGIGFTTAEAFASQSPAHVIIAGRNASKLQESIAGLKERYSGVDYRPLILNLSSQKDVRTAAAELLSWTDVPSIDFVVNSAGIMNLPERTLNEDGIEMQLATNHIGHYLFTNLIMSKILQASKANPKGATRIVNVSSLSPTFAAMRWSDLSFEKVNKTLPSAEQPAYEVHRRWGMQDPEEMSYMPLEAYNQSKVANVLFSIAANRRLYEKHGILSLTVHPGLIQTELSREAPPEMIEAIAEMKKKGVINHRTPGAGSATSLTAALDPKLTLPERKNGKENWGVYLADCQIFGQATALAESSEEAERLWTLSEKLVKQRFDW